MNSQILASRSNAIDELQKMVKPPRHMPALDGLRGLAILLVLACHAALAGRASVQGSFAHLIDLVMGAGWVGVDLFFVLSGFLITGILLATKDSPDYYKSFFARRLLRIFPLYYLFVLFTVVRFHSSFTRFDVASLLFFYYNWQAVHLGHHLPNVNSLWSLAVEEQFYIIWPTIVLFAKRKALVRLSIAGIVTAFILRVVILPHATVFQSAYYLTPTRMDALLVGALLAIWRTDARVWERAQRLAKPVAIFASVCLIAIALWTGHFYDFVTKTTLDGLRHSSGAVLGPGCTLLALLFGAIIVKCTAQSALFKMFNWWPLRRIGKFSYGMYMVHWPLFESINSHVIKRIGYLPYDGQSIICFLLLLVSTFVCAYLSFQLFETHFLNLKRLFPATTGPTNEDPGLSDVRHSVAP